MTKPKKANFLIVFVYSILKGEKKILGSHKAEFYPWVVEMSVLSLQFHGAKSRLFFFYSAMPLFSIKSKYKYYIKWLLVKIIYKANKKYG